MLVLTRKLNEQIAIGEDIKITLIRVRGNTVRLGIEAPRDVRIVRGELEPLEKDDEAMAAEDVFAHPQPVVQRSAPATETPTNRVKEAATTDTPKLFVGTVKPSGGSAELKPAPLAAFVSAS